ncbi:16S rRNA (cytidine(1402)-2'-O)-methyltransferase [Patescibacteria group bacterium]|nr:16S rRNA (cytidine(1402)-2'-O)-methyltransferase [Patescibacteria group bacterium]
MSGTLYIVATPIGNLSDITLRALDVLRSVDTIVAEDTRVTAKLLQRYSIEKPLQSLRARSARVYFENVARMVQEGRTIAYVTDAGTPGISDPGPILVSLVREYAGEGAVIAIPGPSAVIAAVSVSGMPTDQFVFLGFLPHKKGRQKALDALVRERRLVVLYESPYRIKKLFHELAERVPDRRAVIAHELTKLFEKTRAGTVSELLERIGKDIPERGEFVVMLAP